MPGYETTRLWRSAFAPRDEPEDVAELRARIAGEYREMREHATALAGEIAASVGTLTVHDATHLDALWGLASDLAGEQIHFTATEGFVFGGAVLLHDLGMGVAAYPAGPERLKQGPEWRDALALVLHDELGRYPTADEIDRAASAHEQVALEMLLRRRHAEHAEGLGRTYWDVGEGDAAERTYLIPSNRLRGAYGGSIGTLAASHWWPVTRLRDLRTLNPEATFPGDWVVDLVKLAVLLRAADAVHLDARRAPALLQALRQPTGLAELHWEFQRRMHRPTVDGERVRFTSDVPFAREDCPAWWLGFDLVSVADRELHGVDDLLSSMGRTRIQARRVQGAESPTAFAAYVQADGWVPVDASFKVSDVARLVSSLGAADLYGDDATVPLRELLQNASDGVRVRRELERREGDWGSVRVEVREVDDRPSIRVVDTGAGMSLYTLTTTLLDFGRSTWTSEDLVATHPGLAGRGFRAAGRFGIGFFSTLMWGDRITVVTRQPSDRAADTRVLELIDGVQSRPLVRDADERERLLDPGTAVEVRLDHLPDGTPAATTLTTPESLEEVAALCARVAPTSDVTITVCSGEARLLAVDANDWMTLPDAQLLARCDNHRHGHGRDTEVRRLADLRTQDGALVGRASLSEMGSAVLTAGAFLARRVGNLRGVLLGDDPTVARDNAVPLADRETFVGWLAAQADAIASEPPAAWHLRVATTMQAYDLPLPDLPLCLDDHGRPLRAGDVTEWAADMADAKLVDPGALCEWLEEQGYKPTRVDRIMRTTPYLSDFDVQPLDFSEIGVPPVSRAVSLEPLLVSAIAAGWGVEVDEVERLEGRTVIGEFAPTGDDVAVAAVIYTNPRSTRGLSRPARGPAAPAARGSGRAASRPG